MEARVLPTISQFQVELLDISDWHAPPLHLLFLAAQEQSPNMPDTDGDTRRPVTENRTSGRGAAWHIATVITPVLWGSSTLRQDRVIKQANGKEGFALMLIACG